MLCFLQKFKPRFLFSKFITARDVCNCLLLRSRDFGSMKDSGGVVVIFKEHQEELSNTMITINKPRHGTLLLF